MLHGTPPSMSDNEKTPLLFRSGETADN